MPWNTVKDFDDFNRRFIIPSLDNSKVMCVKRICSNVLEAELFQYNLFLI